MNFSINGRSAAPVRERMFNALCEHPCGLTVNELIEIVYRGAKEPAYAVGCVQAASHFINARFKDQKIGLRIRGSGGRGSRYRIYVIRQR